MTFRSVVLPERYDLTRVDVERNVTQCVDTGLALAEVLRDARVADLREETRREYHSGLVLPGG